MTEITGRDAIENSISSAINSKDTYNTNTRAERLLLQQHSSLLVRGVATQITNRAINTVIVVLTLVNLMISPRVPYVSFSSVCFASLIACVWYFEQRLLALRLAAIEKELAKKNEMEFEDMYINYRFESSSTRRFWVLRFEPLLWLAVVAINAVFSIIKYL